MYIIHCQYRNMKYNEYTALSADNVSARCMRHNSYGNKALALILFRSLFLASLSRPRGDCDSSRLCRVTAWCLPVKSVIALELCLQLCRRLICYTLDRDRIVALSHDAYQRLGSRRTREQSAAVADFALCGFEY